MESATGVTCTLVSEVLMLKKKYKLNETSSGEKPFVQQDLMTLEQDFGWHHCHRSDSWRELHGTWKLFLLVFVFICPAFNLIHYFDWFYFKILSLFWFLHLALSWVTVPHPSTLCTWAPFLLKNISPVNFFILAQKHYAWHVSAYFDPICLCLMRRNPKLELVINTDWKTFAFNQLTNIRQNNKLLEI